MSSSRPDVGVLIPAYNAEKYIGEAIDSALAQRGVNTEVIVVDDGSTDRTLDEVRRFGAHVKWETGPNRGAPSARNRALELSCAPWVQYLDADDYLYPEKTSKQLKAFEKYPDADLIYGPSTIEWHRSGDIETRVEPIPEPHDPFRLLALWDLPQTGAVLMRRDALLAIGGWREEQPCCQEHELFLRMLMNGSQFAYYPSGGAVYRRFESGTLSTSNMPLVRSERCKIEARLENFLRDTERLTDDRLWAINQARFEMARSAWPIDRCEARQIASQISGQSFQPNGDAAPLLYRVAYAIGGFSFAEHLAAARRSIPF